MSTPRCLSPCREPSDCRRELPSDSVYVRGAFYYHAWPEIFIEERVNRGHWLPVDPTFNQFPADATHFRLARGGLDKQAAIIPMIGNVKLYVSSISRCGRNRRRFSSAAKPRRPRRRRASDPFLRPLRATAPRGVVRPRRAGACPASWGGIDDCDTGLAQTIRSLLWPSTVSIRSAARRNSRLPRTQRRRQDNVDQDNRRAVEADIWPHSRQRLRSVQRARSRLRRRFVHSRSAIHLRKLTAGEFLRFHAGLYGMDRDGLGQRMHEMLELFELVAGNMSSSRAFRTA